MKLKPYIFKLTPLKVFNRFILFLLLSLSFKASANVCNVNQPLGEAPVTTNDQLETSSLTLDQVARLEAFLKKLTPEQREKIFAAFRNSNPQALLEKLKQGSKGLSSDQKKLLQDHADLRLVLFDLLSFHNGFPGLFKAGQSADIAIQVLNHIQTRIAKQELRSSQAGSIDITAGTLRDTIVRTVNSLIRAARDEYNGIYYGAYSTSVLKRMGARIDRWISPLYSRIMEAIDRTNDLQKQVTRIVIIDNIVIDEGLARAADLNTTEAEQKSLLDLLTDSPEELSDIIKQMREFFGEKFERNDAVNINEVDVRVVTERIENTDFEKIVRRFDSMNLATLTQFDAIIDQILIRQKLKPREPKDFSKEELQMRLEIFFRYLLRYKTAYFNATGKQSNEAYTVEDKYYVTVKIGERKVRDLNGTEITVDITEQQPRYRKRTVHPSFENLLSSTYDEGDRNVSGLDEIIDRAQNMVAREGEYRDLIATSIELSNNVVDNYSEIISDSSRKNDVLLKLAENHKELTQGINMLEKYSKWSDKQILSQYSEDSLENFRQRNTRMLKRLANQLQLVETLTGFLQKNEPALFMVYDLWDFSHWLEDLKTIRNHNYIQKGVLTAGAITAGVTYNMYPPFEMAIDAQIDQFLYLISPMTDKFDQFYGWITTLLR